MYSRKSKTKKSSSGPMVMTAMRICGLEKGFSGHVRRRVFVGGEGATYEDAGEPDFDRGPRRRQDGEGRHGAVALFDEGSRIHGDSMEGSKSHGSRGVRGFYEDDDGDDGNTCGPAAPRNGGSAERNQCEGITALSCNDPRLNKPKPRAGTWPWPSAGNVRILSGSGRGKVRISGTYLTTDRLQHMRGQIDVPCFRYCTKGS